MDSNAPRQLPANPPNEPEQTFARRISCAPPREAPAPAAPLRPGAHGTGQRLAGGNGR
ncbi:MAG: hypothetical protein AVDCRST_MAG68-3149 [uncultured Gemmatimonadetes bacterium]|uniref:Uncharacterized protein n=1 Tax=uncultured Gemmatimonadota bacterium TaxID=203437 RepID=A0A6J4LVP4_9BACT|nr:MAG: hypothetical protein AVDCRST_MAG68-3149 [uncultured Gemmatimonadota bacterium]